jgi:NADPH2:quinone reductase
MVSFGNASGPVPPFDLGLLTQKGSLFITRPSLFGYTSNRKELETTAQELFDIVRSRQVKIEIGQRYPLAEAAQAHRDMESRKTTGASILIP